MQLTYLDIVIFVLFFAVVISVSLFKSRKEETGEDYFLAGRGLVWPLIGFSLIAANISTEQFVGMSGQGASMGLAVACYEWLSAVTLVIVALLFLPKFLSSGIYTIPEYLEYRYNPAARIIMTIYVMLIYVLVAIAAVVYSGGLTLHTIFDMKLTHGIWLIGSIAAVYTIWGGLKAVAWADLFQGAALIIGGAITMFLGFKAVGGPASFFEHNANKLHVILPASDSTIPWTSLLAGIWIPCFYYWGLNQFIMQRTLAAKTLRHGQFGILFAAALKLLIPFIIILPGIMAAQLYSAKLTENSDAAYPTLIRELIPIGFRGFIFAAVCGAVISSLASMLNSASTLFSIDIYKRHINPKVKEKSIVWIGRAATLVFVLIACGFIAPRLGDERLKGIWNFMQSYQGYVTPGILAAFVFGLAIKRAPSAAAISALLLNIPIYGLLQWKLKIAFLNRMAITFGLLILVMAVITIIWPLTSPKFMPKREDIDLSVGKFPLIAGGVIIILTILLYIIFW